jgi:hypothetical protein
MVTRLLDRHGAVADVGPVGGQNCDGALCGKAPIGTRPPVRRQQAPPGTTGRQILNKAAWASCPTGQTLAPGRRPTSLTIVPDHHDRAAELLVCGDQQVPVVAPGEAFASVATAVVVAGPVGQPGPVAGFVAGQGGDGDASAGAAAHP